MKRILFAVALAVLLAPAADLVFGKGHVQGHKEQRCHNGRVITVSTAASAIHAAHGDIQLPACDNANVFMPGDSCTVAEPNPPNPADGQTPACPADGSVF